MPCVFSLALTDLLVFTNEQFSATQMCTTSKEHRLTQLSEKKEDLEDWISKSAAVVLRPFSSLCGRNTVTLSHKINIFILLVVCWIHLIGNHSEEDFLFVLFFWSCVAVIMSISFSSSCTLWNRIGLLYIQIKVLMF